MDEQLSQQQIDLVYDLHRDGGFFRFCQLFYPILTGRAYQIPRPKSRRPHVFQICEQLEYTFYHPNENLDINVPPGHLKTTHLVLFIPWTFSIYPDCQNIYTSYSTRLAATQTAKIRALMQSREYQELFFVELDNKSSARDDFKTTAGGRVYAAGFGGTITGVDAGLPFMERYSGALFIDDIYNVSQAASKTIIAKTEDMYVNTLLPRLRGPNVPTICICQNTGAESLIWKFIDNKDVRRWRSIVLPAIDGAGNALAPEIKNEAELAIIKEQQPYLYDTQYQQERVPLGTALFKEKDFAILDVEPKFITSFITVDCAETDKTYNDATSFTFCGVYKLNIGGREIDQYGLHIINNWEERLMPAALEQRLKEFYAQCCMHPCKPSTIYIERKSTGTTLVDVAQSLRGVEVIGVDRTIASGSKADRFIAMQKYIKQKLISFTWGERHVKRVIDHMCAITPAMSHAHDDICDTICDAIDVTYVSRLAVISLGGDDKYASLIADIAARTGVLNEIHGNGMSAEDEIGFYR